MKSTEQIPEEEKVVPKKRKSRRRCYASDDPSHVCSANHVRVPAHCRVKRFRSKKSIKPITTTAMPTLRTFVEDPAYVFP